MADKVTVQIGEPAGTGGTTPDPADTPKTGPNGTVAISTEKPQETPAPETKKFAGKYDSPEALEQAYIELQKKLGAPKDGEKPAETVTPDEAQGAAEKAGVDLDAVSKEYLDKGAISEDTYKALEAKGLKRSDVDGYIAGQAAVAKQIVTDVAAVFGGEQKMAEAFDWFKANLSDDEITAANKVFASGDVGQMKLIAGALNARYVAANGSEPTLSIGGDPTVNDGVEPYLSQTELTRDMSDPRYKSGDVAFQQKVYRRLAKTEMFAK